MFIKIPCNSNWKSARLIFSKKTIVLFDLLLGSRGFLLLMLVFGKGRHGICIISRGMIRSFFIVYQEVSKI